MPSPRRLQAPNAFDHLTSRRAGAARLADTDAYDDDAAAQKENHHPEGRAGSSALRPLSGDDSRMLIERVAPLLYTQGRKDEAKRVVEIARLLQGGGAKARARGGELAEYRDDAGEELASPGRTAAAAAVPERAPAPARHAARSARVPVLLRLDAAARVPVPQRSRDLFVVRAAARPRALPRCVTMYTVIASTIPITVQGGAR